MLPGLPAREPAAPIWISPQIEPLAKREGTTILCPQCHQPSPLTIVNESNMIHESCCIRCLAALYFILVHPAYCTIPAPQDHASRIAALNSRSLIASPIPSAAGTGQTITVAPLASSSRNPANNLDASDSMSVHSPQR